MANRVRITPPKFDETQTLAKLWHASWTFAHAHLIDTALLNARTLDMFESRMGELLDEALVARLNDRPIGFSVTKEDELHQFFMSNEGRRTGAAAQLIQVTEQKMAQVGITNAHLYCLIGNDRAMAFYSKMGWVSGEILPIRLKAKDLTFAVECQMFTKGLI